MAAVDQREVMAAVMGGDPGERHRADWLSAVRQAGGGSGRHGGGPRAAYAAGGEGDARQGRLQGRTAGAAASHRPYLLQSDHGRRVADAVGVRLQHRRPDDGLGHGAVAAHQPGAFGQRWLVDLLHRGSGAGLPRPLARRVHPRQRRQGLVRLGRGCPHGAAVRHLAGDRPIRRSRPGWSGNTSCRPSSSCRSFRSGGICRPRRGGTTCTASRKARRRCSGTSRRCKSAAREWVA